MKVNARTMVSLSGEMKIARVMLLYCVRPEVAFSQGREGHGFGPKSGIKPPQASRNKATEPWQISDPGAGTYRERDGVYNEILV